MVKCCREVLWGSVVEKSCREVLYRSVAVVWYCSFEFWVRLCFCLAEECCRGVLWWCGTALLSFGCAYAFVLQRSVVEECWRGVGEECWREVL